MHEKVLIWQLVGSLVYSKQKFGHKDICFAQLASGVWTEKVLQLTKTLTIVELQNENQHLVGLI